MKRKKVLSTAVAAALVAAQMVMPVAAADTGSINTPVGTKTPVLRVVVPTTMNIAVDQFEMSDAGSQIFSSAFTMENKSEVAVKLEITSTVVPGTNGNAVLVETKDAAETSTTANEVWLATAAQTAANAYGFTTDFNDLDETSDNVTTFKAADKKAVQTYYLQKAAPMAYKLLNANESAADIEYAQFYELDARTYANTAALQAAAKDAAIYSVATVSNGATLTRVDASTTEDPTTSNKTYYEASTSATAKGSIDASKLYVYGDGTADADGKAGFRFIGKLSEKNETWTGDNFGNIQVDYTIVGVRDTVYDALAAQTGVLTYGFYKEPAPAVSLSNATANTTEAGVDFDVTFTQGTALTCAFTGLGSGVTLQTVTWGATVADTTSATTNVLLSGASFTINSNMWGSASSGDVKYIKLTASDSNVFIVKVTIA